ncbi:hypothetical protein K438DRAFT_1828311 [Mycena galopus ATCC 62051]|nr:hypothetical protein K438DRAFT_1828311 [Mycena galopus ATCC 62051]
MQLISAAKFLSSMTTPMSCSRFFFTMSPPCTGWKNSICRFLLAGVIAKSTFPIVRIIASGGPR